MKEAQLHYSTDGGRTWDGPFSQAEMAALRSAGIVPTAALIYCEPELVAPPAASVARKASSPLSPPPLPTTPPPLPPAIPPLVMKGGFSGALESAPDRVLVHVAKAYESYTKGLAASAAPQDVQYTPYGIEGMEAGSEAQGTFAEVADSVDENVDWDDLFDF